MRFIESLTDFFRSPKWLLNALLGGVCLLIPFVGPVVLLGWHITGFFGRKSFGGTEFGDFDFNNFVKYLMRGLWPVLVSLVASLACVPVILLLMVPMFVGMAAAHKHEAVGVAGMVLSFVLVFGFSFVIQFIMIPLQLRAAILQDFAQAFSFRFVKDFFSRVWLETLLAVLFYTVASIALVLAGYVMLCFGVYLTMSIAIYMHSHLGRQLYDLYVQRGGEPLPGSPQLSDAPLPPPAAPPPSPPAPMLPAA